MASNQPGKLRRHELALILNSKATKDQLEALAKDLTASNNLFYCRVKHSEGKEVSDSRF
jgi:hypothetical protein